MKITDVFPADDGNTVYSVELAQGFQADVKVNSESGLIYVMENVDGSTVFNPSNPDITYPSFSYDASPLISLVKSLHAHCPGIKPLVYDSVLAKLDALKAIVDVLTPQECAYALGRPIQSEGVIYYPIEENGREVLSPSTKPSLCEQISLAKAKDHEHPGTPAHLGQECSR